MSGQSAFGRAFLGIIVGVATLLFLGLISKFLIGVFWALVLAVLFRKLYLKIAQDEKSSLAAFGTVVVAVLTVIGPIAASGVLLVNQTSEFSRDVASGKIDAKKEITKATEKLPDVVKEVGGLDKKKVRSSVKRWEASAKQWVTKTAKNIATQAADAAIEFGIAMYLLFFLLRDGGDYWDRICQAVPIDADAMDDFAESFQRVTVATVKGGLLVALIQGAMGGVTVFALGVPAAAVWGVAMVVASLLPVGAAIVWLPIAGYLAYQGQYWQAGVLVAVGVLLIGLIDNLLRPRLVANEIGMPDPIVFLATIGGLAWFGISGIVLGPAVASLFLAAWRTAETKLD